MTICVVRSWSFCTPHFLPSVWSHTWYVQINIRGTPFRWPKPLILQCLLVILFLKSFHSLWLGIPTASHFPLLRLQCSGRQASGSDRTSVPRDTRLLILTNFQKFPTFFLFCFLYTVFGIHRVSWIWYDGPRISFNRLGTNLKEGYKPWLHFTSLSRTTEFLVRSSLHIWFSFFSWPTGFYRPLVLMSSWTLRHTPYSISYTNMATYIFDFPSFLGLLLLTGP